MLSNSQMQHGRKTRAASNPLSRARALSVLVWTTLSAIGLPLLLRVTFQGLLAPAAPSGSRQMWVDAQACNDTPHFSKPHETMTDTASVSPGSSQKKGHFAGVLGEGTTARRHSQSTS